MNGTALLTRGSYNGASILTAGLVWGGQYVEPEYDVRDFLLSINRFGAFTLGMKTTSNITLDVRGTTTVDCDLPMRTTLDVALDILQTLETPVDIARVAELVAHKETQ